MCLFPKNNTNYKSIAYKKGLKEFSCGHCPECLSRRANVWALRSIYQARESKNFCMITLTYDTFKRDSNGVILLDKNGIPLENLTLRSVDKRDCQLFIKRLREYFSRKKNVTNIKYLLTAEYGKTTGRPHYHALLFGVSFDDLIFHKKSKRGNSIYRSKTLEKLWKNGICTVDSVNISAGIVKYCTKYSLKDSGIDDTFSLFSHNIGINELLKEFNGRSYFIDGNEYPIPREVWQKYIENKYAFFNTPAKPLRRFTYRYINNEYKTLYCPKWSAFYNKYLPQQYFMPSLYIQIMEEKKQNNIARQRYRNIRDNDIVYKSYIEYWKSKAKQKEFLHGNQLERILALDNKKYWFYKVKCLEFLREFKLSGYRKRAPRCEIESVKPFINVYELWQRRHLPLPTRHIRANDRKKENFIIFDDEVVTTSLKNVPVMTKKYIQLNIFD